MRLNIIMREFMLQRRIIQNLKKHTHLEAKNEGAYGAGGRFEISFASLICLS